MKIKDLETSNKKLNLMVNHLKTKIPASDGHGESHNDIYLKKFKETEKNYLSLRNKMTKLSRYLQIVGIDTGNLKEACETGILWCPNLKVEISRKS